MPLYKVRQRHNKKLLKNDDGEIYSDHLVQLNQKQLISYFEKTNYAFVPEMDFLDVVPFKVDEQQPGESDADYKKKKNNAFKQYKQLLQKGTVVSFTKDLNYDKLTEKQKAHMLDAFGHLLENKDNLTNNDKVLLATGAVLTQQYINLVCKPGCGNIELYNSKECTYNCKTTAATRMKKRYSSFFENLMSWMAYVFTFQDFEFAKTQATNSGRGGDTAMYMFGYEHKNQGTKRHKSMPKDLLPQPQKQRFQAIMKHFKNICSKIPISHDCIVDLVSKEKEFGQKFIKHTREYIFRFSKSSAVSARYLGEQVMQQIIPDKETMDQWTTGTLLSHCIIVNRFLQFYEPARTSKPLPNGQGKYTLKSDNPKHFRWQFRDVPLNFDYITEGEMEMLQKKHASILLPVRIKRNKNEMYQPAMRNRTLALEYTTDIEDDDENEDETTTPDNTTTSEASMGEEPGENDTDYEN
jgi:hypothetical protein